MGSLEILRQQRCLPATATDTPTGALDEFGMFEHLYVQPEAWFGGEPLVPERGQMAIGRRPGIGFEPDLAVIERFGQRF